jgi:DNA-directed RNA polymerase specialized sigma24 family protein
MDNEFDKRLNILFNQSYDWLFRVAINMTKNKADAEDLVQSLFVYLLEKRMRNYFIAIALIYFTVIDLLSLDL